MKITLLSPTNNFVIVRKKRQSLTIQQMLLEKMSLHVMNAWINMVIILLKYEYLLSVVFSFVD